MNNSLIEQKEVVHNSPPGTQGSQELKIERTSVNSPKFVLAEDLFKMLKFVRKDEFTDQKGAYTKERILSAFTFLCQKVNVYDQQMEEYNLSKSDILQRIFNCSETFK